MKCVKEVGAHKNENNQVVEFPAWVYGFERVKGFGPDACFSHITKMGQLQNKNEHADLTLHQQGTAEE